MMGSYAQPERYENTYIQYIIRMMGSYAQPERYENTYIKYNI